MTAGHRHRFVAVERDGRLVRVLRGVTVHRTDDLPAVEASRFVYSPDPDEHGRFRLSLLGFLHGLTGLTLMVDDVDQS